MQRPLVAPEVLVGAVPSDVAQDFVQELADGGGTAACSNYGVARTAQLELMGNRFTAQLGKLQQTIQVSRSVVVSRDRRHFVPRR